jgi:hypothetical protein
MHCPFISSKSLSAGVIRPQITPEGVVLSPIEAPEGFGGRPKNTA